MRNLELYSCKIQQLASESGPILDSLYDNVEDRLYFIHDGSLKKFDGSEVETLCPLGGGNITDVSLSYLDDLSTLCIAFNDGSDGNVLLYNINTETSDCVGTVDGGIICSRWSPDQEIFLLVTKETRKVLLMNREFDLIHETEIFSEAFGEGAPVTVGWGKKETQFHGSEGKHARGVKVEVVNSLAEWDDRLPRVTWRGDGKYFAVSSVEPEKEIRRLKIFDRDGKLQYTSEPVPFLEPAVAWKPSGALIAGSQRTPTGYQVVFFETNGLRHGEFSIQSDLRVISMDWNGESNVLALCCERRKEDKVQFLMQLWTTGNYHWYLKQELTFGDGVSVQNYYWDSMKPFRLHLVLSSGEYRQYQFRFSVSKSCGVDERDLSNVYVVDGGKILVTPFRKLVVPPPMSAYEIHLGSVPVLTQPAEGDESVDPNSFVTLLQDGSLLMFHMNEAPVNTETVKVTGAGGNGFKQKCEVHSLTRSHNLKINGVVNGGHFLAPDFLVLFHVNYEGQHVSKFHVHTGELITSRGLPEVVESHCCLANKQLVLLTTDKKLLKLSITDLSVQNPSLSSGLEGTNRSSSKIEAVQIDNQEFIFILADSGHLYCNGTVLSSGVTSFQLSSDFLLMTTFEHTLRCVPLLKSALDHVREGKPLPGDVSIRRVERGSRLVTHVPKDTKVILQMPRGNLETVHPRVLVVQAVAEDLGRSKYRSAFVAMRRHRINLNFPVDHNPEKFINELDKFVDDVDDPAWISQFITDLQEEELSFSEMVVQKSKHEWKPNKVDFICNELKKVLEAKSSQRYIFPILTCYVKLTKPDYDGALKAILELRRIEESDPSAPKLFLEGLRYLFVLVDMETLYRSALGTYDLNLALLVAENSQKDPKEFLPFLQDLEAKDENNRRYAIDLFLKRYDQALRVLAKCGPTRFDELRGLVVKHSLYSEGLDALDPDSEERKTISRLFGDHLLSNRYVYEAGVYYYRAEAYLDALSCFRKNLDWKMVFSCGMKLGYSESEMEKLYRETAQLLANSRRFADAATIYRTNLKDVKAALAVYLEGSLWEEAIFCSFELGDKESETKLKEALVSGTESLTTRIANLEANFTRSTKRLEQVRKEKEEKEILIASGEDFENPLDAASEVGSTITGTVTTGSRQTGSSRTARSSKNKRKLERKLYSTKEGSPYEDLGIIVTLHEMISNAYEMRGETHNLCKALIQVEMECSALQVQANLEELINVMIKQSRMIWPTVKSGEDEHEFGPEATAAQIVTNAPAKFDRMSLLEPHLRYPPLKTEIRWKINLK